MAEASGRPATGSEDFSIVLGGPLYQLFLRTHLALPGAEALKRRLIGIPLFAWLPLFLLALIEGHAWGPGESFLKDVEVHARFLGSITLMIVAEAIAHRRVRLAVRQFETRGLIEPAEKQRFDAIVASAMRLRNSVFAEVVQLVLAFALHWLWGRRMLHHGTTWIGSNVGGEWDYTAAGFWYAFLSLPLFRLFLFRWYFRMFIWYRFIWQVSRLNLRLDALHPDRAAGLGFLSQTPTIFTPLLLAHSVMVTGYILNRIWYSGKSLYDFKIEIVVVILLAMFLALAPLFFFMGKLAAVKRKGNAEYGVLASRYVAEFREKWLAGGPPVNEALIGSADIQSLADLSGAYDAVRETRMVPLTRQAVLQLLFVTALPMLPLALTLVSAEELFMRVAGFLF